jgi:hypothetical protein
MRPIALAIVLASPVVAEDLPLRPVGCERIATAQYDNCSIANVFRCPGEAAFWIETLDKDNLLTIETRNADHGSMSVTYAGQDVSMQLTQSKMHPRDVIREGLGSDQVVGTFTMFGMSKPISGETEYSHIGETEVLAGETFARIAFVGSVTLPPPMPKMEGSGSFLYSDRLDLLVEEETRFNFSGAPETHRLAHLALPGQKGFGDETPGYGCGELSHLSLPMTKAPT